MTLRHTQQCSSWGKLLSIISLALGLSACMFAPGGHMDYKSKSKPIERVVDVKPITAELVNSIKSLPYSNKAQQKQLNQFQSSLPANYDYLVGRGDVLNIIVYDHPELTIPAGSERSAVESGNVVHSDGAIFYPYIGQVHVAGRTVRDIRNEIQFRLAEFIAKPQVDVSVAAFKSQKVYVTGRVRSPGTFPITNVPKRVLDVLSDAGGLTDDANWHEVVLTRDGEDIRLSAYDMLMLGDLKQNLLTKDGDLLHVPDVGNQQVYVMGEVNRATALSMGSSRLSLTNAIARAGGIREGTANASGIFVVRRNADGSKKFATVYQLNARDATAFVLGSEFLLEPTDVIYVTAAPIARWNRVVAQLLPSVTAIYQATGSAVNVDTLESDSPRQGGSTP